MKFGIQTQDSEFYLSWIYAIYTEAFQRLGVTVSIKEVPGQRLHQLHVSGEYDGDLARIDAHENTSDNLVKVTVAPITLDIGCAGFNTGSQYQSPERLDAAGLRIVTMQGYTTVHKFFPVTHEARRMIYVKTPEQGLKMIAAGRADVLVDVMSNIKSSVTAYNKNHNTVADGQAINKSMKSMGVLIQAPIYAFLHKQHRALATRLSEMLSTMKKDGTIESLKGKITPEGLRAATQE